jgi:hypothetical protein
MDICTWYAMHSNRIKKSCIMQLIGPDREKYAEDKGNKNLTFTGRRGASQLERFCQLQSYSGKGMSATEGRICQQHREGYSSYRGKDLPATGGKVCQLQRKGYVSYRRKGMPATEGRIFQLHREGYSSYRGKDMPATGGKICQLQREGYASYRGKGMSAS